MEKFILLFSSLLITLGIAAQPANDECINAIPLSNELQFCTGVGEFSNEGATTSLDDYPACIDEEAEIRDVWFSFVAQATEISINLNGDIPLQSGGSIRTPQFVLWSGECDDLTRFGCADVNIGQNGTFGIYTDLVPGETYYLSVGARLGRQGSFQICMNQFFAIPEPSGDCNTGVILCDKSAFTVGFLSGDGVVRDDLGDVLCMTQNCSGGNLTEANSIWYRWTCDDPGTLAFNIDPLGPPTDDIDFLLYELPGGIDDCAGKENIRCMLSGQTQGNTDDENFPCLNNTGLSLADPDDREECGCQQGNNNFAQAIDMEAGKSYALLIMNFSGSGAGFNISFGGTGTFLGPEAEIFTNQAQVCVGEVMEFSDNSQSVDPIVSQEWFFGSQATPSTATGPGPHAISFNRPGEQFVRLVIETSRGCQVTEILTDIEVVCCEEQFDISGQAVDLLCADQLGGVDLTTATNFAPLTYEWSDGSTQEDLTGVPVGTYTVTITDNATCQTIRSFDVNGPPPYSFDTLIQMPTCDGGQDGILTFLVEGGTAPYEFSFDGSPFGADNTIAGIPVGDYRVQVRDANGCLVEQTIPVTELVLTLDPMANVVTDPRCFGENNASINVVVANGAGPYRYDFNDGNGLRNDAILDQIGAGIYQVEVRDANNCRGDFSFSVEDPPAIQTGLSKMDISCFGERDGEVSVSPSGGRPGYTFNWSNGGTSEVINGLSAGPYSVTITDDSGCPIVVDTLVVEPSEIVGMVIDVMDNTCFGVEGGGLTLSATGGTAPYTFSSGDGNFQASGSLSDLGAGVYAPVIMDSEGCTDTLSATIEQPEEFVIDPGIDLVIDLGFDTTLNAMSNYRPVVYTWSPEDVDCLTPDCSRVLVGPFNSTVYTVTGVNSAGCEASADVRVIVTNNKPVFIPNGFSPDGDGFNDGFTLFGGPAVAAIEQLRIFHRWGGLVYESPVEFSPNDPSLGWDGTANGEAVNSGVFVYQFRVRFLNGETGEYAGDLTVVR